jgi:alpha-L-arabinofuranosidase
MIVRTVNFFIKIPVLTLLVLPALSAVLRAEDATTSAPVLEIDFQAPTTPVSPILHGLMTEEINFSYDGGLYAELIRNRVFRNDEKDPTVNWSLVKDAGAEGEMRVVDNHP